MLRTTNRRAGAALAALVFLASSASVAAARGRYAPTVEPAREMVARVRCCVPANGAQVLGGYAAPTDLLDPVTGEICNPRPNWLRE